MDAKLKTLLEKIGFLDTSYFEGGSIEKIIGNKNKDSYCFYINLKTNLPTEVLNKFNDHLKSGFKDVLTTSFFYVENENIDLAIEYVKEFIRIKYKGTHWGNLFLENELVIENNKIIINLKNKAEENKILEDITKLQEYLKNAGFQNLKVITTIKETDDIFSEINEELKITPKFIETEIQKKEEPTESFKPKFQFKRSPLIVDVDNEIVIIGSVITDKPNRLDTVVSPTNNVTVEAYLYGIDIVETKTDLKIITLKITDDTDSIYGKIFVNDVNEFEIIKSKLKTNVWYRIRGSVKLDQYAGEITLGVKDINIIEKTQEDITDDAESKRVELHTHTTMSQMDGIIAPKTLINTAKKWGHKAIAVTDHNGVQSYPEVYHTVMALNKGIENEEDKFKVIYGSELVMVDDKVGIITKVNDTKLLDNTYVVFDVETTGFNAGGGDSIIEIGAVKILNGEIIDTFSELINPGRKLPAKITEITNITDEMLIDKPNEEEVVKRFIHWYGNLPLVAHNAKFDMSFINMAYQKYTLGTFDNIVIDTLELSRTLDSNFARHSLSALVKRYNVPFDEDAHHRADYDALGTALVFHKMLLKLTDQNYELLSDLEKLVSKDEIHKFGRTFHVNLLVKNQIGLKNLFKIVSLANTKYLHKTPRILRSEIENHREGLLIGSGCYESEVFREARSKNDEELSNIIEFYDYVEIQPLECYDHLLESGEFANKLELVNHVEKIIRVTEETGKIMVATGDVHHLKREDKIYREIIVNQKVPGGGRHPLSRNNITKIPSQHLRTTREMLSDMEFLGDEVAYKLVVTNSNLIEQQIEHIKVIKHNKTPFSPKMENSEQIVRDLTYNKAKERYGNELDKLIEERIEAELKGIIGGGFDVIYLIAQKLVKKSNDEGYLVGSRGSVGSSVVAYFMGITEVNSLPPHYVCPNCKKTLFEDGGVSLGKDYGSGYDLPDKECVCGHMFEKDGQDMPFATFLGFDADKVPDIDLNFSGEYQWKAHEYTKELFGEENVYRAGTIGTVAEKTAFGFVKGYCEDKNIIMRKAHIEKLSIGCTGVKRTTGQHPGGIIVIPEYMDVFDFTPFQYPADDPNSKWYTSHFDYHPMEDDLLKLDILGHDDPTTLRMLQDLSGIDVTKIDMSDKDVMKLFSSPNVLGVTKEQILCPTGTLGVPELGTKFVINMLVDTKPTTFAELLKISGLSHGTDVWVGNAKDLIDNGVIPFKEVIGCRDDIMVYLMYNGVEPKKAFKIMEFVRKGMPSKLKDIWQEHVAVMKEANIPEWYIESCQKIKYMFPKAHAVAYVISALRIAWFKVHKPIIYYAAYFSVRCHDFDIEAMIKGYDAIKSKIIEIQNKGYEATNKEVSVLDVLNVALEATARGYNFGNVDLYKSDSFKFIIDEDQKTLIPPFRTIDGLGDTVANNIVLEREKGQFLSIEDLQKRSKLSTTLIDKMRIMGILDGMDESSQLSLF